MYIGLNLYLSIKWSYRVIESNFLYELSWSFIVSSHPRLFISSYFLLVSQTSPNPHPLIILPQHLSVRSSLPNPYRANERISQSWRDYQAGLSPPVGLRLAVWSSRGQKLIHKKVKCYSTQVWPKWVWRMNKRIFGIRELV